MASRNPPNNMHADHIPLMQHRFLEDAPNGRIAVLRLHLASGQMLRNRLIMCDAQGRLLHHSPLISEECSCKWYRGDWYEEVN